MIAHVLQEARSGNRAQDGADGAGVETGEPEGQGDEFVEAGGDVVKDEAFEDREVMSQAGVVGGEVLGVEEIDAGGVDSDQANAALVKPINEVGRKGGEVLAEIARIGVGAGGE